MSDTLSCQQIGSAEICSKTVQSDNKIAKCANCAKNDNSVKMIKSFKCFEVEKIFHLSTFVVGCGRREDLTSGALPAPLPLPL